MTSLDKSFTNVRKRVLNTEVDMDSVKKIIDKAVPIGTIFHKLLKGEHLVWPGLNTCNRIFELNHKTLKALYLLSRMNFASVLLVKSMAGMVSPEKIVFITQLSKFAVLDAEASVIFWENAQENSVQQELLLHSKMCVSFFKLVACYAVLRCNLYEKDGLMVKKKNYNQIIWENHLLLEKIKELNAQIQAMPVESGMHKCFKENQLFIKDFISFYMNYYMDEAEKSYKYLQDSIDNQIMDSAEQILDHIALTNDFIEKVFDKYH
jgi:hypothetical protein